MRSFCKALTGLYMASCITALLIIPLNTIGLVGEPDPLASIFAVLLSVPWIWLAGSIVNDGSTAWNMIVAGVSMALNALILWSLCTWLTGKIISRRGD